MPIVTKDSLLYRPSTGQYPLTLMDLYKENPTAMFSKEMEATVIEQPPFNCKLVKKVPKPYVVGMSITEGLPKLVDGCYQQHYVITELTEQDKQRLIQEKTFNAIDSLEKQLNDDLFSICVEDVYISCLDKDLGNLLAILARLDVEETVVYYSKYLNKIYTMRVLELQHLIRQALSIRGSIVSKYLLARHCT